MNERSWQIEQQRLRLLGSNNNNAVFSNAHNDTVHGGHAEMREIRPLLPRLERDALAFFCVV